MSNAKGTKNAYKMSVILSSERMSSTGKRIVKILKKGTGSFHHLEVMCDVFANGEVKPWIPETVRGEHVFVLQDLQEPNPNTALIQLLLTIDALSRASVEGITLVLPYLPYLRQDRKDRARSPISARAVANFLQCYSKVERLITVDMHVDQEQGFSNIPVDNIRAYKVHAAYFKKELGKAVKNVIVVSPDLGGGTRAKRFAQELGEDVPVGVIDKRRTGPNQIEVLSYNGPPLKGKVAIIYDDMIDTGGTIRGTAATIKKLGAREAYVCVTHGIFSRDAEVEFNKSMHPIVISSSIPRSKAYRKRHKKWLTVVSIDEFLAEAIHQASLVGGSVSKLS